MKNNKELIYRLTLAINKIDGLYDVGAKWKGVKTNVLSLLYALDDGKPHTQKSLSEEWLIPPTTLNTIVKECVRDELIILEQIPGKRRDLNIRLTEKGKKFSDEIMKEVNEAEDRALSKTIESFDADFINALECYANNLSEAFDEQYKKMQGE